MILTTTDELDLWMSAPWTEASALQQPFPDGALQVITRGEKKDGVIDSDRPP